MASEALLQNRSVLHVHYASASSFSAWQLNSPAGENRHDRAAQKIRLVGASEILSQEGGRFTKRMHSEALRRRLECNCTGDYVGLAAAEQPPLSG